MYEVLTITERDQLEPLGSKEKFWFCDDTRLCKIGRPNTGENWAEKVAYELAKLVGIPTASYELAVWQGKQAVVSEKFVPAKGRLVHGNEILAKAIPTYDAAQTYKQKLYKLSTVMVGFDAWQSASLAKLPLGYRPIMGEGSHDIVEMYVAYLIFDCWIGNQDRHDQNWGFVLDYTPAGGGDVFLAPSYDHASSLACRMLDEKKKERLVTKDKGYSVAAYAEKATTPFYSSDGMQLKSWQCVDLAAKRSKKKSIIKKWLERIISIETDEAEKILTKIPTSFGMTEITVEFTKRYLEANKQMLMSLGSRL